MTHGAKLGYMGEKRKALVEKYGYDCKNGAHLLRLLRMGIEFLTTGEMQVDRPEKHQLIEIKQGLWSLEKVQKQAEKLFETMEYAYINSKLKAEPDYDEINKLLLGITEEYLRNER